MSEKYTCSVCSKEFDEEEYKLTNDSEKCILHCEKDDWHQTLCYIHCKYIFQTYFYL